MTKVAVDESLRAAALAAAESQTHGYELETWMALMAGGWEVVHGFDQDGRCFLVACQTAPQIGEAHAALAA